MLRLFHSEFAECNVVQTITKYTKYPCSDHLRLPELFQRRQEDLNRRFVKHVSPIVMDPLNVSFRALVRLKRRRTGRLLESTITPHFPEPAHQ